MILEEPLYLEHAMQAQGEMLFPTIPALVPTASTLLLIGVWQSQRQKERTFVQLLPGGPNAAPSSPSLAPATVPGAATLCPDKMLSRRLGSSFVHISIL